MSEQCDGCGDVVDSDGGLQTCPECGGAHCQECCEAQDGTCFGCLDAARGE